MMMNKLILYLIFLITITAFSLKAKEPLILENADELIGNMSETSNTRFFVGNVKFKHGDVHTVCDTAIWNLKQNTVDLMGNVIINQTTLTLMGPKIYYNANTSVAEAKKGVTINDRGTFIAADRGFYHTKSREVNFFGNVLIDDDSVEIRADHIHHFRNNRNTYAFGKVNIRGKYNSTQLFGDTVINLPQLNYAMATSDPVLMQIDTNYIIKETNDLFKKPFFTLDTLLITCDTIKSFRSESSELYRFIDSVNILREEVSAKAGYAIFDKFAEQINLIENPILWYENTQLFGDTLLIKLLNNKLNKISSINKTFVVALVDTSYSDRLNQITGDYLEIKFDSSEIASIISNGDVKSLYFLFSDGYPDGADLAAADRIEIYFSEGEAVKLFKISGVSGEVLNEDLIKEDIKKFYLPGFRYRNDKVKKKTFNLHGY